MDETTVAITAIGPGTIIFAMAFVVPILGITCGVITEGLPTNKKIRADGWVILLFCAGYIIFPASLYSLTIKTILPPLLAFGIGTVYYMISTIFIVGITHHRTVVWPWDFESDFDA